LLRSMTGYGRCESEQDGNHLTIEIWSVNHRYLDLSIRLPRPLGALETKARKLIQERVGRGKITLVVNWDLDPTAAGGLTLDRQRLDAYLAIAEELRQVAGIEGKLGLTDALSLPDVVKDDEPDLDLDAWWTHLSRSIQSAVEAMMALKDQEGAALAKDLLARIGAIEALVGEVETRAPVRVDETRERLRSRIAQISSGGEVDPYRLEQEVLYQADRMDVTEECVRLRTHLAHFREFAGEESSAGRKLNFLLQEMNREATTIGSKANDAKVAMHTVRIKEELERIREQVQNVE